MHDGLFDSQEEWSGDANPEKVFQKLAGSLGLDPAQFASCLEEGKYADRVSADFQEGVAAGVEGTPAFRINGSPLSGAVPFSAFQQQIEYYLAGGEEPTLEVDADSFRSMGQADAPVVITEFSDYQCPACARVEEELIPDLIEQYVDTGKARFVYREFPLTSIHPAAQKASEAAFCAGQQGLYWEMHEKLFESQGVWGAQGADPLAHFKTYADGLGLDTAAFGECLDSGETATLVQADLMAGESVGVSATPFFFVGDLPIRGGLPIEAMGRVIDYVAAEGPRPEIVPAPDDYRLRGDGQTAKAITVAFVDYANPESGDHAREVLPALVDSYIDSGELLYILHPWSDTADSPGAQAAAAAECAGEQGQYWEMHDQLFDEQEAWTASDEPRALFADYAESLGLASTEFEECLDSDEAKLRVEAGSVVGALYGVPSAPVFLFNDGSAQQGSPTLDEFKAVIDSIINR
jgi:protein-disulfide isomerase